MKSKNFNSTDNLDNYAQLSLDEIWARGSILKKKLGSSLYILTHHYQRDEVFYFHDAAGDSLQLAKLAAESSAQYIVFCGVHFMAESADILTSNEQIVLLPNLRAGCSLADMAKIEDVKYCWQIITEICGDEMFIPITYINSDAQLKAFCGQKSGSTCTSSNANKVMQWALQQNKKILFMPDQHLGRNTANSLGLQPNDIKLWQYTQNNGGLTNEEIKKAKVLLWDGYCATHAKFNLKQIETARIKMPDAKIICHPECPEEVVKNSDIVGSTDTIIKTVKQSPAGSKWVVATENSLVKRLQQEVIPQKKQVQCLNNNFCICPTMYQTSPLDVLIILENLIENKIINQISVPENVKESAQKALERMLKLS